MCGGLGPFGVDEREGVREEGRRGEGGRGGDVRWGKRKLALFPQRPEKKAMID